MSINLVNIIIFFIAFSVVWAILVAVFFSKEIKCTKEKDPAAKGYLEIILLYPGLHALISHRIAHAIWNFRLRFLARYLSQISRFITGIEIHPGAQIGDGLFIDHGMGVVIGETTIIGNNVTLFQGVTLGGTGKETGKRHPTLGNNVVVGTGAKVLGNITVGDNTYVGANAVVLRSVPSNTTVVGVPGHITKKDGKRVDPMDHGGVSDPVMVHMKDMIKRIKTLEDSQKRKS